MYYIVRKLVKLYRPPTVIRDMAHCDHGGERKGRRGGGEGDGAYYRWTGRWMDRWMNERIDECT